MLRFDEEEMRPGTTRAIPPDVEHQVEPAGDAEFWIEFLTVDRAAQADPAEPALPDDPADQGGDPACWAGLLCPQCGAVMDGNPHKAGCPGD